MMAEGKRKQEWYRTAVSTCLIANTWRGKSGALKVSDFPYQKKETIRMATPAECKAFAAMWNANH
ncbi:MAG: hypothetical protein Q4A17_04755 [Thermoguttaceae bacterium]|nr:hypothetical protein [Thermoguttaceae bacterium]